MACNGSLHLHAVYYIAMVKKAGHTTNKKFITQVIPFIYKNRYCLAVILLLVFAACIRFYQFDTHISLGNDDGRDVAIAREALQRGELPLIGSFSSAGPFAFGPLFYWVIMGSYLLLPFTFYAPWIVTGIVSVMTVFVLLHTGRLIGGNKFALLVGLLAATSPQLVARSLSLGQHSYVALASACLFLSFVLLWQKQKIIFAFLMGLSLGVGLSMHYQTINLLLFFPLLFFVPKSTLHKKCFFFIAMLVGFLIPSLPILVWDMQQQFANTRNILDYLLIGQYRIYVANSWRLFLFQYFPQYWGFVIGHYQILGTVMMLISALVGVYLFVQRKLPQVLLPLGILFSILFLVNRYYRGERSEGYLLYLLPFILLFSSYAIYTLLSNSFSNRKVAAVLKGGGMLLLTIVLIGNIHHIQKHFLFQNAIAHFMRGINVLESKYPGKKFSIYDYKGQASHQSQAISLLLKQRNKTDKQGIPIGFLCYQCKPSHPLITEVTGLPIVDLQSAKNLHQQKVWINVNQESMYDDLIGWSKKHELKSNFSFRNYLYSKFNHD
jgi:hypothetical protein